MKTGRNLMELAQEITRQSETKKDYLADTRKLTMSDKSEIRLAGVGSFAPTELCHSQISQRLKIPKQYYDRMRSEQPELLSANVNTWLEKNPETRMVRTLDGKARAFLSDKYRTLDNQDLLETALPILQKQQCEIVSCEITDRRLYLKALFPKIEGEVKKGDVVQAGICISNSEVGAGSLSVQPLLYRLVCLNGMITNTSMRKYHVGGRGTAFEDVQEVLSDRTKQVTDAAFWMQVQDIIKASFNRDIFDGEIEKLRAAADESTTIKDPTAVVEIVRKDFGLREADGRSMLEHLIKGGDYTKWGVANSVTRIANDLDDYEEATRLEKLGSTIIELGRNDWKRIAEAV